MYWPNIDSILELLKNGWRDLAGTNFSQMNYSDIKLAEWIGSFLIFAIAVKLLFVWFGRNKYARADSGHLIYAKNDVGFLPRFLLILPVWASVVTLAAMLMAIAGPFFTATKDEKKYIETRTRVDIQDVSGSMGVPYWNLNKIKAEISMEAHLKFLEMRKGKKDRTSFWLFSDNAFLKQDFTVDENLFYFQVYDAPWEYGSNPREAYNWDAKSGYPKTRYEEIAGEGETQMSSALRAVVKQFDEDDARQKKSPYYKPPAGRAVLILTDAIISDFDQAKKEIEELKTRRVTIYIIFIEDAPPKVTTPSPPQDPEDSIEEDSRYQSQPQLGTGNTLLDEIVQQGGRFFPVSGESSLMDAYREIDRLEKVKIEIDKKIFKVPVFYKFVFVGILSLLIIIPGLFIAYILEYP